MSSYDLKLGFNCDNNCRPCVIAEKRPCGSLNENQIFELIDNLPEEVDEVQITGGEPTLYPFLPEVLKRIKSKNINTIMQTNGTGFSDKELCEKCLPYLDHVHIAIHSCFPEVHDFIVQSKGMWEKTITGLYNIKDYKDTCITTQTVLSKYNILTIYDTFDFIQSIIPGTMMSFTYPHMMGNAYTNRQDVCFRYSDYYIEIQRILARFHEVMYCESIPFCYLHPYTDVINNSLETDIYSNTYGRIGVDFSDGFNVKDYNYLNVKDHRKGPRCKECIYNNKCIGVWKEYIELYKDNLDLYPIVK